MSDMSDAFRDMKEHGREKRAKNRDKALQIFEDEKIDFILKNNGAHLIVTYYNKTVDFWPGTGLWIVRHGIRGRGIFNLIKHLGV